MKNNGGVPITDSTQSGTPRNALFPGNINVAGKQEGSDIDLSAQVPDSCRKGGM